MTTLAQTMIEAEALMFAREWIADRRNMDFDGLGPMLDPRTGRACLRAMLRIHALSHPLGMMNVIDYARAGWDDADDVMRVLIVEFMDRGERLPPSLYAYSMEIVRPQAAPRPRGRAKASNFLQDIAIVTLVWELTNRFNLKPTRNSSSRTASACGIAAVAVTEAGINRPLNSKAVEALWTRYSRDLTRTHRPKLNPRKNWYDKSRQVGQVDTRRIQRPGIPNRRMGHEPGKLQSRSVPCSDVYAMPT